MEEAELRYYFPDCKWASCRTSVYSLVECNRDAAHALYAAGFKDVDEADALGHSPISVLEIPDPEKIYHGTYTVGTISDCLGSYLNLCAWYKKKGARLDRPFGLAQETALHHIAGRIGKGSADILDRWYRKVGNDDQETIVRRFSSDWISIVRPLKPCILRCILKTKVHRDLYACACTVGGCLPMNVLINETIKGHRSPKAVSSLACMFLKTLWLPDTAEHDQWLAPIFLRACTFACLGMPHTCQSATRHTFKRLPGEYHEHHSDPRMGALVSQFKTQYRDLGLPLCLFLTECWPMAMEKAEIEWLDDSLAKIGIVAK
ncbi:hypothetical protein BJY01DRAFT_210057 [Aspergillus pseudoustus]|uniref:Uncharacterized protein n=1 Tax=Aspergillus pseudoustus TaxID=1810923 RepID=A0ABR4KDI9_9EURO